MLPDGRLRLSRRRHRPRDRRRTTVERLFLPFERLGAEQTRRRGHRPRPGALAEPGRGDGRDDRRRAQRRARASTSTSTCRSTEDPRAAPATSSQPERTPFPTPVERGGRVLYIEDNLANLDLVSDLRAARRARADSGDAGPAGHRAGRPAPPDLILLDLHLPDIDGEEVLRRLRADARTPTSRWSSCPPTPRPRSDRAAQGRGRRGLPHQAARLAGFVEAVERALGRGAG